MFNLSGARLQRVPTYFCKLNKAFATRLYNCNSNKVSTILSITLYFSDIFLLNALILRTL